MKKSKRALEGYLLIDNRASGGSTIESAVVTCSHCQRQVVLNPNRSRERHYCAKCDKYICDWCAMKDECLPMAKVFEIAHNQAAKGEPSIILTDR